MKYLDGQEAQVGDELLIEGKYKAVVVNVLEKIKELWNTPLARGII